MKRMCRLIVLVALGGALLSGGCRRAPESIRNWAEELSQVERQGAELARQLSESQQALAVAQEQASAARAEVEGLHRAQETQIQQLAAAEREVQAARDHNRILQGKIDALEKRLDHARTALQALQQSLTVDPKEPAAPAEPSPSGGAPK